MTTPEEEYHVTIDFQNESPDLSLPYSLIGLETAHPILRIDREIYIGTWATMVGTEMIFDEQGEWVTNVARRLVMNPVEVQKKDGEQIKTAREMIIRAEDLEDPPTDDQNQQAEDQDVQAHGRSQVTQVDDTGSTQLEEQAGEADVDMSDAT